MFSALLNYQPPELIMSSVNQITLIGNIGKDIKMTGNEANPCAIFSIATENTYKNREGQRVSDTEWHRVVAFGQTAKFIEGYASTGRQAYVQGRIRTRSYQDKEGATRYVTEIVADTFNLLGNKPSDDNSRRAAPAAAASAAPAASQTPANDDDIPF
jgi:single-strand DNA-binding protein